MVGKLALTIGLVSVAATCVCARALAANQPPWSFAASGDSRNCGDLVMPTIAKKVKADKAEFYWHLGDFRWLSQPDQDMNPDGYDEHSAWQNFIDRQLIPFTKAGVPVFLGIGNHELYGYRNDDAKARADYESTFSRWIDAPLLRRQRLQECRTCTVQTYYDWNQHQVNFIYLDNASEEGFGPQQLAWLKQVIARDSTDGKIRTVIVGMHRALPNSWACAHSMNGDPGDEDQPATLASIKSGREAYIMLLNFAESTGKKVYLLASHSHFYLPDIFETDYWKARSKHHEVLPGTIVGTAGAQQYGLPADLPDQLRNKARNHVYGYLLARVNSDGGVDFQFNPIDPPHGVAAASSAFSYCFGTTEGNNLSADRTPRAPKSCFDH